MKNNTPIPTINSKLRWVMYHVGGLFLAALVCLAPPARAAYTLTNMNTTAQYDPDTSAGLYNWTVDGVNQLATQWFYYRVGSASESGINNVARTTTQISASRIQSVFTSAGSFRITISYWLSGSPVGSGVSDISQTISIDSLKASGSLDFHLYMFSDFDLQGTATGDTASFPNSLYVRQMDTTAGTSMSEIVVSPGPTHKEINTAATLLTKMTDGVATTLADTPGVGVTFGAGNVAWAYEWDLSISPGGSVTISTDNLISFAAPVTTPPVITCPNNITVGMAAGVHSATVTYTPTATGSPTPVVTCAPPSGSSFSIGTSNVTCTATNSAGTNSCSFTVTVNEAPAITSANATSFTVGGAGSFTVTTTGTPIPGLTKSGTLPSALTFTDNGNGTATLAGTPAAGTSGSYPLTITANNGVVPNATQSFTLTVNQPPAFTSPNTATFTVGSMGSFAVTATGYPAPGFSITTGSLPSGVTLAPNGTLSGTPAAGTGGNYPITITASNGVAPSATQSFTLAVVYVVQSGVAANTGIPDGSPEGMISTINVASPIDHITDVKVTLDIAGTYNGDLYAYLVHDSGFAMLLNRPGRTLANTYGYGDAGLNVTLDDAATNGDIHVYQTVTVPSGPLTGTWAPDGRDTSPFLVLDSSPRPDMLSVFNGLNPNGDWTLFVADVETGYLSTLDGWGLEIHGTVTPPTIACPPPVAANADSGQCYASGVALGSPTVTGTGTNVANNAPVQFPVGTTVVTWTVTDVVSNIATCQQLVTVTAAGPQTAADPMSTRANTPASVPAFKILFNDTHPQGKPMHIAGVMASGLGSSVSLGTEEGEVVVNYTPPPNFTGSDTFTYTNADVCGMTALGTVNVTVTGNTNFFNLVSIHSEQVAADTVVRIMVMGIPGVSYTLQRAENLAASTPWSDLLSRPAGTIGSNFGRVVFLVTNPPSPTYYRTKTP